MLIRMYDRGEIMSEEEQSSILDWVEAMISSGNLRQIENKKYDYDLQIDDKNTPTAIWKIKKRLIEREGLHEYRQDPSFKDIIMIMSNNGILHPHTDPNGLIDGTIHCRFNVFVQVPDKLDTYYGGSLVEAKNRCYVMCRSGIDLHWTTLNTDDTRIVLSFGYLLPRQKMNEIYKVPEGIHPRRAPLNARLNNLLYSFYTGT